MSRRRKRTGFFQVPPNGIRTVHHIVPKSRNYNLAFKSDNQTIVAGNHHEAYHSLFVNRTPYEILDYLVDYFWGGRIDFVFNWLETRRIKTKGKQPYYEDDPLRKEDLNDTR